MAGYYVVLYAFDRDGEVIGSGEVEGPYDNALEASEVARQFNADAVSDHTYEVEWQDDDE